MRMLAGLKGEHVIILLDIGSSHNYVSKQVVYQLKLSPSKADKIKVRIASGKNMLSHGFCEKVPIHIHDIVFTIDFDILELNDYDIVPDTDWFRQLGSIW